MRVLLADDHQLVVEGLRNILEAHGFEVGGAARDGLEALAEARRLSQQARDPAPHYEHSTLGYN